MINRTEIFTRLQDVFRDSFDDPDIEIFDNMTAEDVDDWDSVTHISLIICVEKEFGIQLNAAEIGELENVGAMINLLEKRN